MSQDNKFCRSRVDVQPKNNRSEENLKKRKNQIETIRKKLQGEKFSKEIPVKNRSRENVFCKLMTEDKDFQQKQVDEKMVMTEILQR